MDIFRGRTALWLSTGVVAFYLLGYWLFGRDSSKIVVDALTIGSAVTIAVNWSRQAITEFKTGMRDGTSNIIVSIWMVWTLLFLYFLYVVLFGALGRPEWLRNSPVGGVFSSLFFLAGAYAILTPVNTTEALEHTSVRRWVIGIAIGCTVTGSMITLGLLKILALT